MIGNILVRTCAAMMPVAASLAFVAAVLVATDRMDDVVTGLYQLNDVLGSFQ